MESEYWIQEKNALRSFLIFTSLMVGVLNIGFSINSSHFRVKTIEIESISNNYEISDFSDEVLNQSIWLISRDTFSSKEMKYSTIENVEVLKEYPNKVTLIINEYPELILVSDLRGTIPTRNILYKNGMEILPSNFGDLPKIVITNGPLGEGFNGELISMLMTFKKYNLNQSNFSFNYDGKKLTGVYGDTFLDLGAPVDLGTKAAALGSLLENTECAGEVRFLGPEEIVADC